jgi:hypothetical protein
MSSNSINSEYVPGSCNIGKGEVQRRQFVAIIGLLFTITTGVGLLTTDASTGAKLTIFLPAIIFSIGFIQARKKFCLAYGFAGTFNFGKLGKISRVASAQDRRADQVTALKILGQAVLLASAITATFIIIGSIGN